MNENVYDLFDKVDKDVDLDELLNDTVSDELRKSMGWPPYDDISVASKEDISKKTSSFDEWVKELEREDDKKSHDDSIDALSSAANYIPGISYCDLISNINSILLGKEIAIPKNKDNVNKDNVNHPNHYKTKSGLETIDVIKAFTEDLKGIEAVDTANIIKYICRWKKKNGLEDLKKAQWYLNDLIKTVEGDK